MTTVFDVQAEVRKLAEERPNFVYDSEVLPNGMPVCKNYEVDGEGNAIPGSGCIVGQAAQRLGKDVTMAPPRSDVFEFLYELNILDDNSADEYSALDWMAQVQAAQDEGETWKRAVEEADNAQDS